MFVIDSDKNLSKKEYYASLNKQLNYLLEGECDLICNFAQFAAFLMQTIENTNWSGFYFAREQQLVLGPYVGKVACTRIAFGQGVCGTAASTKEIQRIDDVNSFAGHIACDSESAAELVFPIVIDGDLIGVLDIDSPIKNRFDEEDQIGIENLLHSLIEATNIEWSF